MNASNWLQRHTKARRIYQRIYYGVYKRNIYAITDPFRVLPDFIIIGAKRAGTTSLYHYLKMHPCIHPSTKDFIGFFDSNFELGVNWYKSHFPTVLQKNYVKFRKKCFMTYDVTSSYIRYPWAAKNIQKLFPSIKLIASLRNPVDRTYSEYNLRKKADLKDITFEDAIKKEIQIIEKSKNEIENKDNTRFIRYDSIVAKGFYADQLKIWLELFPKNQMLFVSTEDTVMNPSKIFDEIFNFLKLPTCDLKNYEKKNVGKYSPMNPETRKFLVDYFKPHNEKLYKMIGKNFDWNK